jgi:hypothetical protein
MYVDHAPQTPNERRAGVLRRLAVHHRRSSIAGFARWCELEAWRLDLAQQVIDRQAAA